ncbi:TonB-dependent receptor plug [Sulfuricurvum kujiense DSM 16994]|uniref:TonB-dependent receptor plug n=1 Tax=Sulfuricurvum kujiense (strain ATCC BAA-921 / DSM 16994 / JCM 11577 / YK-1) TaxID=709032 RepID=E4TW86_SULKY|nr:TonB-dependent receptor [Sulfuricurvum kujiense]ADR32702.1 TonB-dependent receptor plug [Sulfuricurvum kujiense DSM 16994]
MYKQTISFVAAATLAASSLGADELSFHPIVVTATKTEQSLNTITSNVEIITAEEIEEQHYTSLAEALNSLSGISITSNGGVGTTQEVFVRGMDTNKVLVLINGIRYQDPSSTSGANFAHLLISDIEQIELIKGAQSGVWGADASAGVINIITKSAEAGTHTGANVEYGSFATTKWGGFLSHKTDKYDFKISFDRLMSSSFTAQAPKGDNIDRYEKDPYANTTLNLNAHYNPTSEDTFGISYTDINALGSYDSYHSPNSVEHSDVRTRLYGVTYDKAYHNHTLSTKANLSKFRRDELDTGYGVKVFNGQTREAELRDHFRYGENDFIVAGLSKKWDQIDFIQADSTTGAKSVSSKAVFVTNSNTFGDLILTESLRRDDYSSFHAKTTGKMGAKYTLSEDMYVGGNYGTSYTAPNLIQMFNPWGASNDTLSPENTKSYDLTLGYKSITLTYFENRVKDLIEWYDPTPLNWFNNDPYYKNLNGISTFKGYEVTFRHTLLDAFVLNADYTHLARFVDKDGKDLKRRPKREAKVSVNYYGIEDLSMGINAHYVGTRYDQADQQGEQTGRYTLFNFVLNYNLTDSIQLYGKIDNLTDKYYQSVDGYASSPRGYYAGMKVIF